MPPTWRDHITWRHIIAYCALVWAAVILAFVASTIVSALSFLAGVALLAVGVIALAGPLRVLDGDR